MVNLRTLAGLLALATPAACGGDTAPASDIGDTGGSGAYCQRDDVETPDQALPLATDGATGSLCPVGDADWYRFTTGPDDHLLHVTLAMGGDLSPVDPAYVVWSVGSDGAPATVVAATPPDRVGFPLDELHCVAPGSYLVSVRDDGDDAEDFRRTYALAIASAPDPDPAEPNDDAAGAASLTPGTAATGAIACGGDSDWFGFDVAPGQLVQLRLTMPQAGLQPTLRVIDGAGTLVATRQNLSGAVSATDLVLEAVLPDSGRYYAVVQDDDGRDADPDVNYALTLALADDTDPNEPNGHPDAATPLATAGTPCGPAWSGWLEATGNIGAPGDNDWFRLPLSGCTPQGVLEAEVALDETGLDNAARWALGNEIQLALTVVRQHKASPCTEDLTCQALTHPCANDYDCSGLFNTCRPDGFCAGAGLCLPEGRCGANVIQRRYTPPPAPANPGTTAPPPNRAVVSTPLFNDEVIYLRVADFQSDGADRGVPYRVRVRVRTDPDANEPSNVYAPTLLADFPIGIQTAAARPVPVHDCTTTLEHPDPDCCGPDTWISGALSYENDLDFYRYDHPCPGEDCNLRVVYELDGGPVDFVFSVYRESSLWFGGVFGASAEAATQPANSGAWGGTSSCYYAFAGHAGEPYHYHLAVRDLADTRDWDADQGYRFCVERVSTACEAPCVVYEDGCGAP